jgi:hypothetical protein
LAHAGGACAEHIEANIDIRKNEAYRRRIFTPEYFADCRNLNYQFISFKINETQIRSFTELAVTTPVAQFVSSTILGFQQFFQSDRKTND